MTHILNPMLCYNSLDIIPYTIDFYKSQGIDVFVLDNFSTDGSWEYLQDNNIPSIRVDTNETFDLRPLLREKEKVIQKIKPDWIIKAGSDSFIITNESIIETVKETESLGFNMISFPFIRLMNTGEKRADVDPRKIFFKYKPDFKSVVFIHMFEGFRKYMGDRSVVKKVKKQHLKSFCVLDYGNTRGKEKREEEYNRRKKAWTCGLCKNWGSHYKDGSSHGWVWKSKELGDIRSTQFWPLISKSFNLENNE